MAANPHSNLQSLQEVMLAMDAVDTLRHADKLVDQALSSDDRAAALVARLREIYRAQGVQVADSVLAEGVAQLERSRYSHIPSGSAWQRLLARWYVRRDAWLRYTLILPAVLGLLYVLNGVVAQLPNGNNAHPIRLSADLRSAYVNAMGMADGGAGGYGNRIDALYHAGTVGVESGDNRAVRQAIEGLEAFTESLLTNYTLRVVDEAGSSSTAMQRDSETGTARYFLLVEALDQRGRAVAVQIANDDGSQRTVKRYGLEVPQATFAAVRADQQDDGTIQTKTVGHKSAYQMELDYVMPVLHRAIAPW